MKREEAIKIIETVCEKFVGIKADHVAIEQALTIIKTELEKEGCTCKSIKNEEINTK